MDQDDELDDEEYEHRHPRRRLWRTGLTVVLGLALLGAAVAGGVIRGERRASHSAASKTAPSVARSGDSKTTSSATGGSTSAMPGMPGVAKSEQAPGAKTEETVEVSLTSEAVERAGVKTAEVKTHAAGGAITVPATVMSNAYRDTKVNALVGGIVRQVMAELGAPVDRGQPLAVIFSAELFETAPTQRVTVVPRAAVQTVGDRMVVYVPVEGEEAKFAERTVKLGSSVGDVIQVVEGLKPGERVVTDGSFFLRAEAARSRS